MTLVRFVLRVSMKESEVEITPTRRTLFATALAALIMLSLAPVASASAPSPVAAYSFDEGEGTIAYDAAGNHNGTIQGGATWTSEGKYGSALDFNGTSGLVSIADASDLDLNKAFTLEAWVRPDTLGEWSPILGKIENTGKGLSGYSLSAKAYATPSGNIADGSGEVRGVYDTENGSIPTGAWSHVAVTYDGAILRIYINGVHHDSSTPPIGVGLSNANLLIGKLQATGTYFDGKIDEVRLYSEALSEAQIQEDRDRPIPVAAYSFDEGNGTVAHDSAGNHDGTIEGGATWTKEGKYGSALAFDGSSGLVSIADASDLDLTNSFTLEAWVSPNTYAGGSVVSKGQTVESKISGYWLNSGAPYFGEKPAGAAGNAEGTIKKAAAPDKLPLGQWSHLAVTSDGTTLRLYVNGELKASESAVIPPVMTSGLKIGKGVLGNFNGKIDEVRLYDKPLSAAQIAVDRATSVSGTPVVDTTVAAGVDENGTILNGTVDPNGSNTTYQFEYGTSTSYGSTIPAKPQEVGDGTEVAQVSEDLSGLKPETTYHYRVEATNEAGVSVGTDRVFVTSASSQPFFGFQFAPGAPTNGEDMEAVARSGAKYWRMGFDCYDKSWSSWDEAMHLAAEHGIQVIATIGGRCNKEDPTLGSLPPRSEWEPQGSQWETFAYELIDHYGRWGKNGTPIAVWEFWNEPNRGVAGYAFNGKGARTADGVYYGEIFKRIATALREAQNSQAKAHGQSEAQISVLFGGLLTLATGEVEENGSHYYNKSAHDFLQEAALVNGLGSTFSGVSIHPYAFKGEGGQTVAQKVEENIGVDREAVTQFFSGSKGLWITEAGWPVAPTTWANPTSFPGATQGEQEKRLNELLNWVESYREADNIKSMLYYNYRDFFGGDSWDHRAGLRAEGEGEGSFRPGWYVFQEHAGAARWPVPPGAVTGAASGVTATKATPTASVNPHGSTSHVQIDYGETISYGHATASQNAGYGNATISMNQPVTGLKPGTKYYYRASVTNANGETSHGVQRTFTTPPETETFLNDENIETLNGNSGYVSVHGEVHASEELIDNKSVELEYWKEEGGQWKYKFTHSQTIHNGKFDEWFASVGPQNWMVKAIFPTQGGLNKSESAFHRFEIHDGYQFVNRATNKCLDIKFEEPNNEVPAWLWDCHTPTTNGQTFTLVPVETGTYHDHFLIVARNSNKCVDVHGDSQNVGEQLQQWACAGGSTPPSVQIWKRFGSAGNGWGFEIQHSHQCMDDWTSGSGNGNKIDQWPCNGTSAQGWNLKSVDAPPVTTHVSLNQPSVLHGEPGLVNFSGQLDLSGYPTQGATVNVNLDKAINGAWVFQKEESLQLQTDSSGHYEIDYYGVGVGQWRARAVFQGNPILGESASAANGNDAEYTHFTVHKGYHLVNQTSGKCLSANEGRPDNGTKILQWDCSGNPQPGDGQLITWYPTSRWPYFQIRFNEPGGNNAGPCLTVPDESHAEGTQLIEWSCIGEYAGNNGQLWKGEGGEFVHFSVLHSGQCIDDWTSGMGNGNKIDQWPCNGTGAQGWRFLPVG